MAGQKALVSDLWRCYDLENVLFVLSQLVEFGNRAKARVEFLNEITIKPLTVFQEFKVLSYELTNLDMLASVFLTKLCS